MFSALLGDMICLYLFLFLFCSTMFNLLVIMFILIVRFSHSVMTPKKTIDNRVTKVCGNECVSIQHSLVLSLLCFFLIPCVTFLSRLSFSTNSYFVIQVSKLHSSRI